MSENTLIIGYLSNEIFALSSSLPGYFVSISSMPSSLWEVVQF
jgi:hypothetical protein